MSGQRILLVDDEPKILKVVEKVLTKEGYEVIKAADGEEAMQRFYMEKPDLVVLDLMLPKKDGYEVCQAVRRAGDTPIIILSARGEEMDKIIGFRMGVDDYVTKPFSTSELALRIKAVLRRTYESQAEESQTPDSVSYGPVYVNRRTREVQISGRQVRLTAKEFDLLWFFSTHPHQVFTREQLTYQLWQSDYLGDPNTVTVLVRRLREKVEEEPARPRLIRTVWGVGYKFIPPGDKSEISSLA